jgi:hypothetical protein
MTFKSVCLKKMSQQTQGSEQVDIPEELKDLPSLHEGNLSISVSEYKSEIV